MDGGRRRAVPSRKGLIDSLNPEAGEEDLMHRLWMCAIGLCLACVARGVRGGPGGQADLRLARNDDRLPGHAHRRGRAGEERGQTGLRAARLGELRRPPVHLKQRRSAPCGRTGQRRGGQVHQRVSSSRRSRRWRRSASSAGQKQGGNVASYFCAPDGRVLHVVAGPVNAATMLREAKWVVETAKAAIKDSKGDGGKFKAIFRTAHAKKLKDDFGLVVAPVTYDAPEVDPKSALSYSDPTGRPLAPKLPPPPHRRPRRDAANSGAEGQAGQGRQRPGRRSGCWTAGAGAGCWATRAAFTC